MRSGNIERLDEHRLQEQFADAHAEGKCPGHWHVAVKEAVPYPIEGLGMVTVVNAPFVTCDHCQALYFYPGLEEEIRRSLAERLVNDGNALDKKQLRFLRIVSGLTQQQTADALNMDVKEYNKFESVTNTTRAMSIDRQFRLRVLYARLLRLDLTKLASLADHQHPDEAVLLSTRVETDPELLRRLAF
jgi:transcriptional regulator with XRE-family HTH domain